MSKPTAEDMLGSSARRAQRRLNTALVAMRHRLFVLGVLICLSSSLFAGGVSTSAVVKSVEQSGNDSTLVLALTPPREFSLFRGCTEVTVHVTHQPQALRPTFWREPQVTSSHHNAALAHLVQSHSSGATIRLGVMGSGVLPKGNCLFLSRGLRIEQELSGQVTVYSFYEPV